MFIASATDGVSKLSLCRRFHEAVPDPRPHRRQRGRRLGPQRCGQQGLLPRLRPAALQRLKRKEIEETPPRKK